MTVQLQFIEIRFMSMKSAAKPLILIVEDSKTIRDIVTDNFAGEGYDVESAETAQELKAKLEIIKPDTILLDLILPDGDGLSLIKNIREYTDVPVIVISGKADMVDKVVGLEMGADDYVGKPLQMKELSARVKAQLRRYKALKSDDTPAQKTRKSDALKIKIGSWILDREKFDVYDDNEKSAKLTVKEFRLLETLACEAGKAFSREQLLDKARDGNYNTTDRAIDVQILRIRKKLGDTSDPPTVIKAVRGVGYTLIADVKFLV